VGGVAGNGAGEWEGVEDFTRNDVAGRLVGPVRAFVQPFEGGLDAFKVALDCIKIDAWRGGNGRFGIRLRVEIVGGGISKVAHGHEASRDGCRTRRR
jgi:hypothetical protein